MLCLPNLKSFVRSFPNFKIVFIFVIITVACWWLRGYIRAAFIMFTLSCRGVAQSGSALSWGLRGRRFKSCLPDQFKALFLQGLIF